MKGRRLWTNLVSLVLLAGAFQALSIEDSRNPDSIDLQATSALVKRWGSRPSFPESVTFAYYHVYMSRALGQQVEPEIQQRIVEYITGSQQPDGGFTPKPLHTKTSNVIYTHFALRTLDLLDKTEAIDRKSAIRFLNSRIQETGGITATAKAAEEPTLATTYYGIEALRLLGAVDSVNRMQMVGFIQRYREKDKGFTRVEGGVSIPRSTFMGVRTLKSLGALTNKVSRDVTSYLKGTRYSGLVRDQQYRLLPGIEAMAATLETLAMLSAIHEVDADKIHEFINSLFIPENGGFGPRPGLGTTPPSTYHAIVSLVRLGKLPDPADHDRSPVTKVR